MLGRLLGFRRRRQGPSVIFFIFGGMGLFMACGLTMCGVPASFVNSREVASLDQPTAEEMVNLASGTEAIFAAQISPDAPTDAQGLAFAYVEERPEDAFVENEEGERESQSRNWERTVPPPQSVELVATNGRSVTVQLPQNITFMEAQRFEEGEPANATRRTLGYLPGQTLAIHGTWQGGNLILADTLFGGSQEAYVDAVRAMPGRLLLFGLICGGISLLLLGVGIAMRFVGR
ncbi:MAG: hypothetical protein AAF614_08195 [Chloroflexota bacterium]